MCIRDRDAEGEGWGEWAGVAEGAVEDLVGEGLELLGAADGGGAVGLDLSLIHI